MNDIIRLSITKAACKLKMAGFGQTFGHILLFQLNIRLGFSPQYFAIWPSRTLVTFSVAFWRHLNFYIAFNSYFLHL